MTPAAINRRLASVPAEALVARALVLRFAETPPRRGFCFCIACSLSQHLLFHGNKP